MQKNAVGFSDGVFALAGGAPYNTTPSPPQVPAMSAVLNVVLPVFAIMLTGYAGGRSGLLGPASSEALNRVVYWAALPALLFLGTARAPLADSFNLPFLGAFLGVMLGIFGLGALLGRWLTGASPAVACMQGLTAAFSNTGYMGIPLFLAAFGPDRLGPAILATVVMSAVMVGVAVVWLELAGNRDRPPGRAIAGALAALGRNPLVLASVAGLTWSGTLGPAALPRPLVIYCELLGAAAGPCALFAIGLFLAARPLPRRLGEIGWIVALKLLLQPALTWAAALWLFPLDPFWTAAAVVLAALPSGGLTFVVAQAYNVHTEKVSAAILVSTALSPLTLSALLTWFGADG